MFWNRTCSNHSYQNSNSFSGQPLKPLCIVYNPFMHICHKAVYFEKWNLFLNWQNLISHGVLWYTRDATTWLTIPQINPFKMTNAIQTIIVPNITDDKLVCHTNKVKNNQFEILACESQFCALFRRMTQLRTCALTNTLKQLQTHLYTTTCNKRII